MQLVDRLPTLDSILARWRVDLGGDFTAYRNHCYRVANFCLALGDDGAETRDKLSIAVAFHDLGIWSAHTYDYLAPSRALARAWLEETSRVEWCGEIEAMIELHHKIRSAPSTSGRLVERFRQADWIDVSRGVLRFGSPSRDVARVLAVFPNAGFHRLLAALTLWRMKTHPFNPLPMLHPTPKRRTGRWICILIQPRSST